MYGYTEGLSGGFIALNLHCFFVLLVLFGFAGALIWLVRFANKSQLKMWVILALVVGILGSLLTARTAFSGMQQMMQTWWSGSENTLPDDLDLRVEEMEEWRNEMMNLEEEEDSDATEETETTL